MSQDGSSGGTTGGAASSTGQGTGSNPLEISHSHLTGLRATTVPPRVGQTSPSGNSEVASRIQQFDAMMSQMTEMQSSMQQTLNALQNLVPREPVAGPTVRAEEPVGTAEGGSGPNPDDLDNESEPPKRQRSEGTDKAPNAPGQISETPSQNAPSKSQFATLRPEAPEKFTGKRDELGDWMEAMEIYMNLYGLDDDRMKYMVAQQFLSQDVKNWVRTLNIESWLRLAKNMLEYYADPLEEERAWTSLHKLHQTGSVKDYTDKFLQLVVKIRSGVTTQDRMRRYVEGLKDDIRITIRIGMLEGRYKTFDQVKSAAEALDFELWRNKKRSNNDQNAGKGNSSASNTGASGSSTGGKGSSGQGSSRRYFTPKINALKKTHGLTKEETGKRLQENLCFPCGKSGHIARDCPTKETKDKTDKSEKSKK
jgi:Retrotransposon gag protein/Zinc knuckle